MNFNLALCLTQYLTAGALLFQTLELFYLQKIYSHSGPWAWSAVRGDFLRLPQLLQRCFGFIYSENVFQALLILNFLSIFILPFLLNPFVLSFLILVQILTSLRFRGHFNGGADAMALVLLTGLLLSSLLGDKAWIGLLYIAVQSIFSYAVAAWVKIKNPAWRKGQALATYMIDSSYDVPQFIKKIFRNPKRTMLCSWSLIILESSIILCLGSPVALKVWMCAAIIFHLFTFAAIGLNRFVWLWIATYPALLYLVGRTAL